MTEIHTTLNNFFGQKSLLELFPESNEYEFTNKKVFRRRYFIVCKCSNHMVHNGYDYARKKGFGKVRIGKQICLKCGETHSEDRSFWKSLLCRWERAIKSLIVILRDSNVAWEVISKIMDFILPCSKDKARMLFNENMDLFEYQQRKVAIIHYDEQHPKQGRNQKYRLTILDAETKAPVADELFDNKDEETISTFLTTHLDTDKEVVVVTDCDRRYPNIFKQLWGKKVIHQKCLLHLNKLVVRDFGKNTTLLNEYNKYLILDIFYNRKKELKFLDRLLKKQAKKNFTDANEKKEWLKKAKQRFRDYIKKLENERRREKKNLPQRRLCDAKRIFETLWHQQTLLPKKAKARLKMIKENWDYFTAFYHIKDCPATNNALENFYSTSLKTHRKKQLRSDKGILNHMKIAAMKRVEGFSQPKDTLLKIYGLFKLITI